MVRTKALAALALALAFCLSAPVAACAASSYVFDSELSLSGFESPGVTTDAYGDIYVLNMVEKKARIDVYGPDGSFITEMEDPAGPQNIAVDSQGNVYVFELIAGGERQIRRFPPTVYKPLTGEIEYTKPPILLADRSTKETVSLSPWNSLAVDSEDRLYVDDSENVTLFGSAEEGNSVLESNILAVPEGLSKALLQSTSIAIDSVHRKIYLTDKTSSGSSIVRVFELDSLGKPRPELKGAEIDGSTTPAGEFLSPEAFISVDVDDPFGHVFVGDIFSANKVYEFEEDGSYLAKIEHNFTNVPNVEVAVDDGPFSPHPELEGYLFVPSNPTNGHVYAFKPKEIGSPIIEETSVSGITEDEAVLHARVNPNGLPTPYRLEYVTRQQFEESGFAEAAIAGEGILPKGGEGMPVAAALTGLAPETAYRFRVWAENEEGEDKGEGTFKTFPPSPLPIQCANDGLRTSLSHLLPDCRAYELVTPPNTNGRPPTGGFGGIYFPAAFSAPEGNRVSFLIEGGALPDEEGTGLADPHFATRGAQGWTSDLAGPRGEEAANVFPGSASPDQTYSSWSNASGVYIRYPDGHSELVGLGSLGEDPEVSLRMITEGAGHILFATQAPSAVQLEPNAPPTGTAAVYDRSAEGPTHVVSLLPGDEPQKAGEDAAYLGASEDGEGIAFEIGGAIYLRLHNEETFEVAGPGATFAGVAGEGSRVFYLEGGDLFAFDAVAEEAIAFSESGDVTVVNVATGGARAYFVSPNVLTGEPNPNGEEAKKGAENLYLSEEGAISFVGIVTERDVEGEVGALGPIGGLGLWIESLKQGAPAVDPSRTTPAGTTLLFESRADLAGFESEGFAQIYRYDATEARLDCLSCSPTETEPNNDASLQAVGEIAASHLKISNQSPDGKRAFFQTAEPLVLGDTDGQLDVYEWEEDGVGSCELKGGCVYQISGGQSPSPDYLFAMSSSGDDVFFRTADVLVPRDEEATLSIYDARVGGGFFEGAPCQGVDCCEGEGCHPLLPAPALPEPATSAIGPNGNVKLGKKCPRGKRTVKRHGRIVCVKKRHKHKGRHRNTDSVREGTGK